jgi:hypothetical protein
MSENLENFEKWFNDGNSGIFIFGDFFDGKKTLYVPFRVLLQLETENLKPFTRDALEFLK